MQIVLHGVIVDYIVDLIHVGLHIVLYVSYKGVVLGTRTSLSIITTKRPYSDIKHSPSPARIKRNVNRCLRFCP